MASEPRLGLDSAGRRAEQPIRLLWLIDSLTFGGAESLVIPFAEASRERGIDLTVCVRKTIEGNPLEAEVRSLGIEVVNLDATTLRDRRAYRRLRSLVTSRGIELIHSHLAYAGIWGALISRQTGVPLVASLHVSPAEGAGIKERVRRMLLVALLNRYGSRIIVVSAALAEQWREATSLRPEKLEIVRNGIPLHPFAGAGDDVRAELGLPAWDPVVMTVSVLRERKGIDILLRAAVPLLRRIPSCRFVIVGDGPSRGRLEKLAAGLGVKDAVVWTGFRRDVGRLLSAADLFVLPTLGDAFPTAVIEAMAAGKPVIASAVGGVPEIVDSATGILVPPGDEAALAEAIGYALESPEWRQDAGRAGKRKAAAELSAAAWVERLLSVYRSAMGREESS
ncbi:MAG: glycosyltransferase family 4 protein [Thermoanaerobaculia bacterium]